MRSSEFRLITVDDAGYFQRRWSVLGRWRQAVSGGAQLVLTATRHRRRTTSTLTVRRCFHIVAGCVSRTTAEMGPNRHTRRSSLTTNIHRRVTRRTRRSA